jgi:hypothetical protein
MRRSLFFAVLVVAGCSQERGREAIVPNATLPPATEQEVVKLPMNASIWLDDAQAAHTAGDYWVDQHDKERAFGYLRSMAESDAPSELSTADVAVVKRGLYAHAAKLALELDYAKDAENLLSKGLALPGNDALRTQLLLITIEVKRALHDARGEAVAVRAARDALALE